MTYRTTWFLHINMDCRLLKPAKLHSWQRGEVGEATTGKPPRLIQNTVVETIEKYVPLLSYIEPVAVALAWGINLEDFMSNNGV